MTVDREPVAEPDQPRKPSRRAFLGLLGGTIAAATGVTVPVAIHRDNEEDKRQREEAERASQIEKIKLAAEQGMQGGWSEAFVWPGILVVSSDVELGSNPVDTTRDPLVWPGGSKSKLVIQRPFFIEQTLSEGSIAQGLDAGSTTVGFWLPGSNEIGYLDLERFRYSVIPAQRQNLALYDDRGVPTQGERVALQPVRSGADGLIWRHTEATRLRFDDLDYARYGDQEETIHKVCARSVFVDDPEKVDTLLTNYNDYFGAYENVIELPRELR